MYMQLRSWDDSEKAALCSCMGILRVGNSCVAQVRDFGRSQHYAAWFTHTDCWSFNCLINVRCFECASDLSGSQIGYMTLKHWELSIRSGFSSQIWGLGYRHMYIRIISSTKASKRVIYAWCFISTKHTCGDPSARDFGHCPTNQSETVRSWRTRRLVFVISELNFCLY